MMCSDFERNIYALLQDLGRNMVQHGTRATVSRRKPASTLAMLNPRAELLSSVTYTCVSLPYFLTNKLRVITYQYYNRWANHEQSAKLSVELYAKTEKKMEEMQITSDLTWIEVQFMKKAVDEVEKCRTTLKWTYAMAYYLEKGNEKELYEDNQRLVVRGNDKVKPKLMRIISFIEI
jgi:hypothetical protein